MSAQLHSHCDALDEWQAPLTQRSPPPSPAPAASAESPALIVTAAELAGLATNPYSKRAPGSDYRPFLGFILEACWAAFLASPEAT